MTSGHGNVSSHRDVELKQQKHKNIGSLIRPYFSGGDNKNSWASTALKSDADTTLSNGASGRLGGFAQGEKHRFFRPRSNSSPEELGIIRQTSFKMESSRVVTKEVDDAASTGRSESSQKEAQTDRITARSSSRLEDGDRVFDGRK